MTPAERARAGLERFRSRRPDAAELARLACLAVRIEPHFLRRLRLEFLPEADIGIESDLWFSGLVSSRGAAAVQLDGATQSILRDDLATDRMLADRVAASTDAAYDGYPPALRLEQRLNALAVVGGEQARTAMAEALRPALATLVRGGSGAMEVARWALEAAGRLHRAVVELPELWSLAMGASLLLGGRRVQPGRPPAGAKLEDVAIAIPSSITVIPVRIGLAWDDDRLHFEAPAPNAPAIELPNTAPRMVSVAFPDDPARAEQLVEALPGRAVAIDSASRVVLTTLAGDVFVVSRTGEGPADVQGTSPRAVFTIETARGKARGFQVALVSSRGSYRATISSEAYDEAMKALENFEQSRMPGAALALLQSLVPSQWHDAFALVSVLRVDEISARFPWEWLQRVLMAGKTSMDQTEALLRTSMRGPWRSDPTTANGVEALIIAERTDERYLATVRATMRRAGLEPTIVRAQSLEMVMEEVYSRAFSVVHIMGNPEILTAFRQVKDLPEIVIVDPPDSPSQTQRSPTQEVLDACDMGVRIVLSVLWAVSIEARSEFLQTLYEAFLTRRQSIERAVAAAREAVRSFDADHDAWAAFGVYAQHGYRSRIEVKEAPRQAATLSVLVASGSGSRSDSSDPRLATVVSLLEERGAVIVDAASPSSSAPNYAVFVVTSVGRPEDTFFESVRIATTLQLPALLIDFAQVTESAWIWSELRARVPADRVLPTDSNLRQALSAALNTFDGQLPTLEDMRAHGSWPERGVHPGDQGDAVRRLQELLRAKNADVIIDGHYGPAAVGIVAEMQRQATWGPAHPLVADGVVGPATWELLGANLSSPKQPLEKELRQQPTTKRKQAKKKAPVKKRSLKRK